MIYILLAILATNSLVLLYVLLNVQAVKLLLEKSEDDKGARRGIFADMEEDPYDGPPN